jgi:hypothetical protein
MQHSLPLFEVGDWVKITNRCIIGQYIGRIAQIIDINEPDTLYGRPEYICNVVVNSGKSYKITDQVFWEHELEPSDMIPVDFNFDKINPETKEDKKEDNCNTCDKPSVTAEEKKEDEPPKTIWI